MASGRRTKAAGRPRPGGPLAPLLATTTPTPADALRATRWLFALLFLAQVALAALVGSALVALVGPIGRPNDAVALTSLVMSAAFLAAGAVLVWFVTRRAGRGAAVAGATAGGVALSAPAWFAVLVAASGQRPPYVAGAVLVAALAFLVGLLLAPRCARAASGAGPERATAPAAPSDA